jgi:hypothetical protein
MQPSIHQQVCSNKYLNKLLEKASRMMHILYMNNEPTKKHTPKTTKRIQRTFSYRGWDIQCDRSGLIWDVRAPKYAFLSENCKGFYDGGYKSRRAAEKAVDQAIKAAGRAKAVQA